MDLSIYNYFHNNTNTTTYTSNTNSASFQNYYSCKENEKTAEKEFYDELKSENNPYVSTVEFGSKEWKNYIDKAFIFPPLNAPREVQNAWKEVKESIPKDDENAQDTFMLKTLLLAHEVSHSSCGLGLPANFQLNTVDDYETLFNHDLYFTEGCKDFYEHTGQQTTYDEFVRMMQDLSDKLNDALSKHKCYL